VHYHLHKALLRLRHPAFIGFDQARLVTAWIRIGYEKT
jgi:hypothetical protein